MRRPGTFVILAASAGPVLCAAGCGPDTAQPSPGAGGTMRERVAGLALRQSEFGAISLLPVRFENSRIAGPFEDGGRMLYCVSSRMFGRNFGKPERARAVIRDENGVLSVVRDDDEACQGQRTQPFPELEAAGNRT